MLYGKRDFADVIRLRIDLAFGELKECQEDGIESCFGRIPVKKKQRRGDFLITLHLVKDAVNIHAKRVEEKVHNYPEMILLYPFPPLSHEAL